MVDNLPPEVRSKVMASITGKHTRPEMVLQRELRAAGFRFRSNDKSVDGTPDIAFNTGRLAVFVDGCFWHGCPEHYKAPSTRSSFWQRKIRANIMRRRVVKRALASDGWTVLEFWEHEILRSPRGVVAKIASHLSPEV